MAGWLAAKNLSVPVAVGGAQAALQRDYGIESTPVSFLLDENGRILFRADGYKAGDETVLEEKIAAALGTAPAASAPSESAACVSDVDELRKAALGRFGPLVTPALLKPQIFFAPCGFPRRCFASGVAAP